MSEDQTMSVDIVPPGDSGEFRITDQMMFEAGAATMEAFDVLLREEARRRGLDIEMWLEQSSRDIIIRWRPAPSR